MSVTTRNLAYEDSPGDRCACGKTMCVDVGANYDGSPGIAMFCPNCTVPEQSDWAVRAAGLMRAIATVKAGRTS